MATKPVLLAVQLVSTGLYSRGILACIDIHLFYSCVGVPPEGKGELSADNSVHEEAILFIFTGEDITPVFANSSVVM